MRDMRQSASPPEEICDFQSKSGPQVTAIRGTVIASSQQILRDAGLFERYAAELRGELRDQVLYTIALSWVPIEVAGAHYAACDALGLDDAQLGKIGELVAARSADTFLGTILRTARKGGLDAPWLAMRALPRLWERIFIGGRVKVLRVGPKDAVLEFHGLPLAQYHYYRVGYCGYFHGLANMFVRNAHVQLVRGHAGPARFALRGSWV